MGGRHTRAQAGPHMASPHELHKVAAERVHELNKEHERKDMMHLK